jgi:hypothetical protein
VLTNISLNTANISVTLSNKVEKVGGIAGFVKGNLMNSSFNGDIVINSSAGADSIGMASGLVSRSLHNIYVDMNSSLKIYNTNGNLSEIGGVNGELGWYGFQSNLTSKGYIYINNSAGSGTIVQVGGITGNAQWTSLTTNLHSSGITKVLNSSTGSVRNIAGVAGASYQNFNSSFDGSLVVKNYGTGSISTIGGVGGYGYHLNDSSTNGSVEVYNSSTGGSISYIGGLSGRSQNAKNSEAGSGNEVIVVGDKSIQKIGGFSGLLSSGNENKLIGGSLNITSTGGAVSYSGGFAGYSYGRIKDSYISNFDLSISGDTSISRIGGFLGYAAGARIYNSFADNINITFNTPSSTPSSIGSFIGYSQNGRSKYNFVLDSPIPSYVGNAYLGSFVGYHSGSGTNFNTNYTNGNASETGTLGAATAPVAVTEVAVQGNSAHAVFAGWDFAAIWDVESGDLPKLQN